MKRFFGIILNYMMLNSLVLTIITIQCYAEEPKPFGLIIGITTKSEAINILKKEGGKEIESGYRIIQGDIYNQSIEGVTFKKLPIDNLLNATFWFFEGVLFRIKYDFPLSMSKEEFYILYNQLSSKYGKANKFVKPHLADGLASWKFKDVEMKIIAPWVSTKMSLVYTHLPLSKKADLSDEEVLKRETSKPKKGF